MNLEIGPRRSTPVVSRVALKRISGIKRDVSVIRACAIVLMIIIGVAGSVAAADVLAPTAIAIVLALVLAPVARAMEHIGLPPSISSVFAVLVTVSALGAIATSMAPTVNSWIVRTPQIVQSVERKMRPIMRQIAAVETASQRITQISPHAPAAATPASEGIVVTAVRTAPGVLAKIVYVTILTIFLLATRKRYAEQLILLPTRFENRLRMSRIVRDVRLKVSRYLFTLSLINVGLVIATSTSFYLAGIPDALFWGFLFGILNFIPVIGPTTAILSAALVGFATGKTITDALAPPLILLALDTVEANFVQPWLLSRRIVISPVAIFLTVVLLVWMWGPPAAITAVPALIIFHTISLHVPSLKPVAMLLAVETDHGDGTQGLGRRSRRKNRSS